MTSLVFPKYNQYDGFVQPLMNWLKEQGVNILCYNADNLDIVQVSLFVGKNYLVCFCPLHEDPFEPVRVRMRSPSVSLVVQLEKMETNLLENPNQRVLAQIHGLKREMFTLRRVVWGIMIAVTAGMIWLFGRRGYFFR